MAAIFTENNNKKTIETLFFFFNPHKEHKIFSLLKLYILTLFFLGSLKRQKFDSNQTHWQYGKGCIKNRGRQSLKTHPRGKTATKTEQQKPLWFLFLQQVRTSPLAFLSLSLRFHPKSHPWNGFRNYRKWTHGGISSANKHTWKHGFQCFCIIRTIAKFHFLRSVLFWSWNFSVHFHLFSHTDDLRNFISLSGQIMFREKEEL